MRLLVLGANGLLGSNVIETATVRGDEVIGTYHSTNPDFDVPLAKLDVCDTDAVHSLLEEYSPDAVINCTAMTDVDGCEGDPEAAMAVNGDAPGELAAACARADVTFAHVSTDYVFDGTASTPYEEDAQTNPVQVYGQSKLRGEQQVNERGDDPLIARLSFVYGIHRSSGELTGFPAWVRDQLQAGEEVPLFTDQHVTPTRAGQAAAVLLTLLEQDAAGTYHVSCRSCVTPYRFGERIREQVGAPARLLGKGSMADVDRPAERPAYSCLDGGKLESTLGSPQPTLAADLDAIADAFE